MPSAIEQPAPLLDTLTAAQRRLLMALFVRVARADRLVGDEEATRLEAIRTEIAAHCLTKRELDSWLATGALDMHEHLPHALRGWFVERAHGIVFADARVEPIELSAVRQIVHEFFTDHEFAAGRGQLVIPGTTQ